MRGNANCGILTPRDSTMETVLDQPNIERIAGIGTALVPQSPREIEGASPLKSRKHERFCWLMAQLRPKADAYRQCGFKSCSDHDANGNAARLLRRADVQERIAYLSRQEEDILQAKRRRIEEALWLMHEVNPADLWETVEGPVLHKSGDKKGEPVLGDDGQPLTYKYQRPKMLSDLPEDVQRAVESVSVSENGWAIPKTYSRLQVNGELRKLLGIGTVTRDDGELSRLSDAELVAELSRQAKELGVEIDLSYRFSGA